MTKMSCLVLMETNMIISVRMHECCEMSEVEVMSDKQTTLVLRVEQCWIVLQIESLTASIRQLEMERTQLYENLKEQRHLSDNLSVKVADLQEDVIRKCVCSLSPFLFSLSICFLLPFFCCQPYRPARQIAIFCCSCLSFFISLFVV